MKVAALSGTIARIMQLTLEVGAGRRPAEQVALFSNEKTLRSSVRRTESATVAATCCRRQWSDHGQRLLEYLRVVAIRTTAYIYRAHLEVVSRGHRGPYTW